MKELNVRNDFGDLELAEIASRVTNIESLTIKFNGDVHKSAVPIKGICALVQAILKRSKPVSYQYGDVLYYMEHLAICSVLYFIL